MLAKNFLKSTVSVFVLLNALTSFSPAYAMHNGDDEGEKEKPSYYQRVIPEELLNLLTPLPERASARNINIEYPDEDPSAPFSMIPCELTQLVLRFLDSQSLLSTQEVSTLWRSLSIEEFRRRLEQSQPGDETENLARSLITSPQHLLWAHGILGKKALLYPPYDPTNHDPLMFSTVITDENKVPEVVRHLASVLKESPDPQNFLCRLYLNNMDILDVQEMALASYFISQVPEMRNTLDKVVTALSFESEKFEALEREAKNHRFLQRYLMALRLLSFSGGEGSYLYKLTDWSSHAAPFIDKASYVQGRNCVGYGYPIWGAYSPDYNLLRPQWKAIVGLSNNDRNYISKAKLKKFWEYCDIVNPEIVKYFKVDYLKTLETLKGNKDDNYIREILRSFKTPNLSLDYNHHYLFDDLRLARLIVEEVKLRLNEGALNDGLMLLKTGLGMAYYNKSVQNEIFSEAGEFLKKGLNHKTDPSELWWRNLAVQELLEIYNEKEDRISILSFLSSLDTSEIRNLLTKYNVLKNSPSSDRQSLAIAILGEARQRPEINSNDITKHDHIFYFQTILKYCDDNNDQKSIEEILATVDDSVLIDLAVLPREGLPMFVFRNHISNIEGHETLAMTILEEAKRRFENDPMILKINLEIAKRIVSSHNEDRFTEAEGYVRAALDHFDARDWSDSEEDSFEESENDLGGENLEENENLRSLFKKDFSPLSEQDHFESLDILNAMRIYQGHFEEALENLDSGFLTFEAIKAQLKNPQVEVPNSLLLLFGEMALPEVFNRQEDWKENFSRDNGRFAKDFLFEIEDADWFLNACIERGILDPHVLQEMIEFCKTFLTEDPTITSGNSGEKEEKEKEKGV